MRYERTSASERRYLPPAVAVSVIAFALRPPGGEPSARPNIWLPLVRRTRAPFLGQWALPGGPIEWNETLTDTANRTLLAAVDRTPGYIEQLYSFGSVERSAEAQRIVTIAYWALFGAHEFDEPRESEEPAAPEVPAAPEQSTEPGVPVVQGSAGATSTRAQVAAAGPPERVAASRPRRWDDPVEGVSPAAPLASKSAGPVSVDAPSKDDDQSNVRWFSVDALPELAFDHREIVEHALTRLRAKTEYSAIAHRFLGPEFTLGQLRAVTEALLGESVDPANFRRQALSRGGLVDTGRLESGAAHRPSRLYRFDAAQ